MEQTTILNNTDSIYMEKYDFENSLNIGDLNNKLFCTFTTLEGVDELVKYLSSRYSIMYN